MCGICGILDTTGKPANSSESLRKMIHAIRHRGPDDTGYYESGPVGLGFCRLSIVDLSGGHQPMTSEDGNLRIVFNGEIYNHPELRVELQRRGHRYTTTSDTESILHAFEEFGEECVQHLRGMFAFAIWDEAKRRLFCARDRFGIKPFYYTLQDGRFAFASEIKALRELPGFHAKLNHKSLPEFLTFGYTSSEETLFDGVHKLMPGCRMTIDLAELHPTPKIESYWDLDITTCTDYRSEADYLCRFEELFEESVRIHLMSDVPLGVFLSGGLDSSAIAAVMSRLNKDQIKTFSVGYTEDQYSELPYAREVAKHISAEYNEVIMGPQAFLDGLPQMIWQEDEPIVWPSSVALYFVSRLARQKVKVVLTGEGSDEIFGGYLKYRVTLWNQKYGPIYRKLTPSALQGLVRSTIGSTVLPDSVRRKLKHTFLYYGADFRKIHFDNFYSVFPQDVHDQLLSPELSHELRGEDAYANSLRYLKQNGDCDGLLSRLLYLDIKTYLVELLMKQDQMSMAASIESRVPFLDHKLVEFVAGIPADYKVRFVSGKYLLRRAMRDKLPASILNRTKKGFPTPIKQWLRHQLFDQVSSVLTEGRTEERGLLSPAYVRALIDSHKQGRIDATDPLWRLLNLEIWHRVFIDRDSSALDGSAIGSVQVPSQV